MHYLCSREALSSQNAPPHPRTASHPHNSREALFPPPPLTELMHSMISSFSPKRAPLPPNPLCGDSLHSSSPRGALHTQPPACAPPRPPLALSSALGRPCHPQPLSTSLPRLLETPSANLWGCTGPGETLETPAFIYRADQALGRPCEPPTPICEATCFPQETRDPQHQSVGPSRPQRDPEPSLPQRPSVNQYRALRPPRALIHGAYPGLKEALNPPSSYLWGYPAPQGTLGPNLCGQPKPKRPLSPPPPTR